MFVNYRTDILENAVKELDEILASNRKEIKTLLSIDNKSYKNFIRPLMSLDSDISNFFSLLSGI